MRFSGYSVDQAVQKETVNVGMIVDSTSCLGKRAKTAIKLAVENVNSQSKILNGTEFFLHLQEAQTPLETISAGVDLLDNEVVALIQTQTSEATTFVSDLGEAAKIPILSLSISSPALSSPNRDSHILFVWCIVISFR
ncbi:glutamate receptor 3.6-like [Cryptomeria japonica]|uniref:glutamate receptor 3.6-like n=1 Tax=Cryptomeria japonica TaxID=3369 RepID=UPI0027DA7507|nr:glutamate receptor 3.6-like [Cryptomeria japonica]